MAYFAWRHFPVTTRSGGLAVGAIVLLAGCQQYERQPLDLATHRTALNERSLEVGRLQDFIDRIRGLGGQTPDTFSFDDGLTLPEGEALALFYNADLRLARLDAGVALANYETAGLWDDPEFGFDGAEILSPSGNPFEFGLTLNLTIPISGRLEVERERAGAAYETEILRIVDAEWTMRARVHSAWAAWTVSREQLDLLRETIEQAEHIVAVANRLESAGELTRVEVRLLRAALIEVRADAVQAKREAARLRIELLGLIGLAPDAEIQLLPSLALPEPAMADDRLQRLIEANTELAVRRAEYQVAEETLRLEIRKQYPDITIGSGYGSEDNDDRLLLGASMPLPIFNANRAGIAEAHARRQLARAAAETTFEQLARGLAKTIADLEAVRSQRLYFENELVPMFDEQISEVDQLADLGEVDTFVLVETVTQAYEAKSRLLELRAAEIAAAADLVRLLGPDDPGLPAPVDYNTFDDDASDGSGNRAAEGNSP